MNIILCRLYDIKIRLALPVRWSWQFFIVAHSQLLSEVVHSNCALAQSVIVSQRPNDCLGRGE